MFLKSVFMAVIGLSFGFLVSAGVFTVLIAVGLVPRFAGKTHTSKKVFLYEEMVVAGTLFGNFISVFEYSCHIGEWVRNLQPFGGVTDSMWKWITVILCIFFGFFAGIFCWMPGSGHRRNAEYHTCFCEKDPVPAWIGNCSSVHWIGKACWQSDLFFPAGIFDGRLNSRLCGGIAGRPE